ncbi:hypothetical protein MNBD_GAMMA05-2049 [hydrothermal vent metagenome]|uniref:Uncharacterized protein n=1 Tax=hydrothermal vent metagenome TaxID=652676 RepID=A0A3B0W2W3_9ZZZZ
MKKQFLLAFFILSTLTLLSACDEGGNERKILVSEVPSNIINVVQNTLPGIALKEAKIEMEDDVNIYELEGKLINGNEYEIKITESGTIIKVELDD